MKLNIRVSKTSDGKRDYVQIMSEDQVTVNIVLVADEITVTLEEDLMDILYFFKGEDYRNTGWKVTKP